MAAETNGALVNAAVAATAILTDGQVNVNQAEIRPHVCEMPDCSAVS